MNIKQLQQQIHQQNKDAGWWDNRNWYNEKMLELINE